MVQQNKPESWRNFFVFVAGKTNGAHQYIVNKLTHAEHNEVASPDHCDYFLVFCPVASRVQSDIEYSLSRISAIKPVILVVMHHTFNPNHILAESRRVVRDPNVLLTVDYLFHEDRLLSCDLNVISWTKMQRFLQPPIYQNFSWKKVITWWRCYPWRCIIFTFASISVFYYIRNFVFSS